MPAHYYADIVIEENPSELALAWANALLRASTESVASYERFIVALSGGHTPEKMFGLLSKEQFISGLPWIIDHEAASLLAGYRSSGNVPR